ncbi:MAG: DUF3795 domain-containing protein [Oscillospiraceae bacterium]|nr:DUF3795 domain-containing protein [Oscillospiraceae bacterium]
MTGLIDFTKITACGECCEGCEKKKRGICKGCIEADGYVPEWTESGRCRVHACAREHNARFCGVCREFPCDKITSLIHWNKDIVAKMTELAERYGEWENLKN